MAVTVGVSVQLALVLSILPLMVHSQCTDGEVRSGDPLSVEVCTNNTWSPLCDNNLTLGDAAVVCRQLGYSTVGAQGRLVSANGTSQGPFRECTGREATIRECPVTTTSMPEGCWHVAVACQPVGGLKILEVCFTANDSEVSNPISAAEVLASEIASSLRQSCECAYSTSDVHASFAFYSGGMLVFRARISYTEPLNESVAALQYSASSTDPTSIDVNGVPFTTLQECPNDYIAPSAVSVTPTLHVLLQTAAKYSGFSGFPPTSSTLLASEVASPIASYSATVQPALTPTTSGPTSSKPFPVAALVAGVCSGVTLIILTGACLGAAVISIKMTRAKKDIPISQRPKQRPTHSYEEVDNESIMDPDHVFPNSVCEVDNISIATRTTQLTTDAIYASVDGALTEQFLAPELLEHPYATLNPYPEPGTYIDTETINPYRVSELITKDRTALQFQEVSNQYAEPDVDNRASDAETGTQDSRVNPYRVSMILLEDRTAPKLEINNPYAEPDVDNRSSDTDTGTQGSIISPYRVSKALLEDTTVQEDTNPRQYSSLDRDSQYATLEPFRGSPGLPKALEPPEDGYSRLKHTYPAIENNESTPDPLTIMETPV